MDAFAHSLHAPPDTRTKRISAVQPTVCGMHERSLEVRSCTGTPRDACRSSPPTWQHVHTRMHGADLLQCYVQVY